VGAAQLRPRTSPAKERGLAMGRGGLEPPTLGLRVVYLQGFWGKYGQLRSPECS
jgi:hypothetical protein